MIYKNKKRGQSAIEWGILLPFLILIIASVLEMAPLMNAVIVVDKSTQYSARSAAVKGTSNEDVLLAYTQNMQGLMDATDLLDYDSTNSKWTLPDNCTNLSTCKMTEATSIPTIDASGNKTTNVTPSRLVVSSDLIDGVILSKVEIVPGSVNDRFSTAWVMVSAKHQYKMITPVLKAVLSGKCETATKGVFLDFCDYFPIAKTSVYRVE